MSAWGSTVSYCVITNRWSSLLSFMKAMSPTKLIVHVTIRCPVNTGLAFVNNAG